MRRRSLPLAALLVLLAAPAAHAGDPIMPLSEVKRGMRCTALSVVQGTEISSFDAEVLDVVVGAAPGTGPMILVRVSGTAVEASGVAHGFSGSPVYCPGADGTMRNAGAISLGLGEYGNKTVLATPIESVIGEPPDPPASARSAPAPLRGARPLATPLVVKGASRSVARALALAGRRAGRLVLPVPAGPASGFPVQTLRPGASVAIGLASGNLGLSAVGTVSYTDGDRVWALGHPLDNAGRRSLLLQDAYVYGVIANPFDFGAAGVGAYKLAAPGHDVGTLTNDAPSAVVGRVGPLPTRIPLRVTARDGDTGRVEVTSASLVDESGVDEPTGTSVLAAGGILAVLNPVTTLLRGTPARLSASLCVRIKLRERPKPVGFCNRYVGATLVDLGDDVSLPAVAAAMARDLTAAAGAIDEYEAGPLHVEEVATDLALRRSARRSTIVGISAPRVARAGDRVPVRLRLARRDGVRRTVRLRVLVPRNARGPRVLRVEGTPLEGGDVGDLLEALGAAISFEIGLEEPPPPPRSVAQLARHIAGIHFYDGVRARFGPPREDPIEAPAGKPAYRDRHERIVGEARQPVFVLGR